MKKFDKEYQTQYLPEVAFLSDKGIRYIYVKKINEVDTYKYVKTPELFKLLAFFYAQNNIDKCYGDKNGETK